MTENKTKQTAKSAAAFVKGLTDEGRREDCLALLKLMREVTGEKAKMWGESMVGFGSYHYKYASGREGDYFLTGFSPRTQNLTVYILSGFDEFFELMGHLGKYKTSKSCLYIQRLEDIDQKILKQLVKKSVAAMKEMYPDKV